MGELERIFKSSGILYDTTNCPRDDESMPERAVSETNLVYDSKTRIVYYKFENYYGSANCTGYMSPYISENGKLCRFIDGKLVEIG